VGGGGGEILGGKANSFLGEKKRGEIVRGWVEKTNSLGGGGVVCGREENFVGKSQFFLGKKQKEETSGDDDAIGFSGLKITPN